MIASITFSGSFSFGAFGNLKRGSSQVHPAGDLFGSVAAGMKSLLVRLSLGEQALGLAGQLQRKQMYPPSLL